MNETLFRTMAKKSVAEYWNGNKTLVKKFGEINYQKVFVVWEAKILKNNKAMLALPFDNDGMYFEFTWDGAAIEGYLDVYKKQKQIVINEA